VTGTGRLAYYAVFAGVAIATLVWIAAAIVYALVEIATALRSRDEAGGRSP
jgi:hypothetical protein